MADDFRGEPAGPVRREVLPQLVVGVLLAAAVLSFVFQNTDKVDVTWLVFEVKVQLWLVLLITAAAALLAGELVGMALRRRRRRRR